MPNQLLAKSEDGNHQGVLLVDHLRQVAKAAAAIAQSLGMDAKTARLGGWLHDIGKAHPVFQRRIKKGKESSLTVKTNFRHELASLAFLSLVPESRRDNVCEMIVGHHKSVFCDKRNLGLLDLIDDKGFDWLVHTHLNWMSQHPKLWEEWHVSALQVLQQLGFDEVGVQLPAAISLEEARDSLRYAIELCKKNRQQQGWSSWRGVLLAADHMVSAWPRLYDPNQEQRLEERLKQLFKPPDLKKFDERPDSDTETELLLYPLSRKDTSSNKPHTLVVAPTGAGKTDYLFRRCRGRVFYLLPFQASINAMHDRIKAKLPSTDIRLLHASSKLVKPDRTAKDKEEFEEEIVLQPFVGAAVKVMTPHQLAKIVFAGPGFEAQLLDVQGADVILDEIHTYSEITQAFVLELARVLVMNGCRVHVGTATMPTVLYDRLLELLGGKEKVHEVKLTDKELDTYNRHVVHKEEDPESVDAIVESALAAGDKLLMVYNTIGRAQEAYRKYKKDYPYTPLMLLHSRFRRADRAELEKLLINKFDKGPGPCLVISTQVVEVSLDISFDRLITETAPLDALIQRFGRVNRVRSREIIEQGKVAPVHVIAPAGKTLPYKAETVKASYEVLPDGQVLRAKELQGMLDGVYRELEEYDLNYDRVWGANSFVYNPLWHDSHFKLSKYFDVEILTCILESQEEEYIDVDWESKSKLEIPISVYAKFSLNGFFQRLDRKNGKDVGNNPFVVPDECYSYSLDHRKISEGLVLEPTSQFF